MRKHIALLALISAMLLLAACGASTTSTTSPTSAPTTIALDPSAMTLTISDPWVRPAAMTGAAVAGDMATPMAGDMATPMAGDMATPMAGDMATPMAGDMATPPMHGTPMAGDMATPMASHMSGGTSAAFMLITNSSSTPDTLIRAESAVAETVELHTMVMEGDVMKMTPVEKIDIPANGSVELKRGGLHVMLIGLRQDLNEGDMVLITLTFQNAGTIQIEAPVRMPPTQ
ncbi:copper chaperone PCu(A)C [Candidatus Oscillochloris fontis]|uniref:copper chaperone PCu(A)C n=1 Tax=Candidatus Oscillochloris fontis TaxID=2496868 RepID=UPI00101B9F8B|nr:copper chaperone PCu(A)C [Candidatus Oscillochloris fontis]